MSKTWEVTWLTTEGPVVKQIEADEMQFSPAGGVLFGKKSNVVPISVTPGQQSLNDPIVIAHVQGYTSLIDIGD